MPPGARKLALTVHVASSVGWVGAVSAFLALAVIGVITPDRQTAVSMSVAMDALGWAVLVPLSLASLVSGVVQALGTPWGLLRHYWVVVKLVITLASTGVLLVYAETLDALARAAIRSDPTAGSAAPVQSSSPVLHAALALVVLLLATVLSIYKPRGLTPYGWRRQQARRPI